MSSNMPDFSEWSREALQDFCKDTYKRMQEYTEEIAALQIEVKEAVRAYRELVLRYADDNK